MSTFECPISRIHAIAPIYGCDRIELAFVMGYQVIVPRGRYAVGDQAAFVPSGAVLPPSLVNAVKGSTKLFGTHKNRVKEFQLRGTLSEGVLVGCFKNAEDGTDVSRSLGITKYQRPLPRRMRGESVKLKQYVVPYDVESFRRYPHTIFTGDEVEFTEKIHGTFCGITIAPRLNHPDLPHGDMLVYSKGLGKIGRAFRETDQANVYLDAAREFSLHRRIKDAFGERPVTIFGEVYGGDIQDLDYGKRKDDLYFALFDVYLGENGSGRFLNRDELAAMKDDLGPRAPVLYRGPFHIETCRDLASGKTVAGKSVHIREGIVITPRKERQRLPRPGRVILKYISPEYMTRFEGTEYQ